MVKHTQTIRRQIADKLLDRVWSFCEIGAKSVKSSAFATSASLNVDLARQHD